MSKHSELTAIIERISFVLCAMGLLLFQTGAYAFLNEKGILTGVVSRIAYYGFWIAAGATAVVAVTLRPSIGRQLLPLYLASGAIAVAALIYPPFGVTSRSLVLFSYAVCVLTTLSAGEHGQKVICLGAIIAAITSATLLAEMFFPGSLSTTAGRSAGLLANPNVAAVALLLSGTATAPFVTYKWRGAFAVLIAAGVFSTVSRTSLLVMFVAWLASMCVFWVRQRPERLFVDKSKLSRSIVTAVLCLGIFLAALQSNPVTKTAILGSASTSLNALEVANSIDGKSDPIAAAQILGQKDSGAARIVLLMNAIGELTIWGHGAEHAHSIAPHNQYVFFAVAFGVIGVLVASGFLISVFLLSSPNTLFSLSLAGALLFTHDLTTIAIAVAVTLGCAGGFHSKTLENYKAVVGV